MSASDLHIHGRQLTLETASHCASAQLAALACFGGAGGLGMLVSILSKK